jgi:hypothetical protein
MGARPLERAASSCITGRMTDEHTMTSFRVSASQLDAITARAKAAGMSRSAYLIACALGTVTTPGLADRVEALERRVEALEGN